MDPKRPQALDLEDSMNEYEPELEDILREFGSEPDAPEESLSDTRRLDSLRSAVPPEMGNRDTVVFQPVTASVRPEPEEIPAEPQPDKEEVEPFSEDWEPEYDQPMGEFIPPEPIPFPESRLRSLRQALRNGPERRFYALMELGLGKLKWAVLLNFLLFAASFVLTLLQSRGVIPAQRLAPAIFCQLVLAMLAVLVGCYRLMEGIGALLRGRFTLELLLLVTSAACAIDGVFCLQSGRTPASALFCLHMLMAQWSAYQRRNTELCQMDTLRKATDLAAVVKMEDYLEGHDGYTAVLADGENVPQHAAAPSGPERGLCAFGALSLIASVMLAVAAGLSYGLPAGVQAMAAALLLCMPATAFICTSRPGAILEQRLHRLGAVLCGWEGIREAEKQAVFPLEYSDLLPDGSMKMNGVRFYGPEDPGRIVGYTMALLEADGKGLAPLFSQLQRSRAVYTVDRFRSWPGGIGGEVDGREVLFGTAEFMEEMSLALPDVSNVNFALYAAVDGQVCGLFVLTFQRSRSAAAGLRALCSDRNVLPVLTACDFLLTPQFIRSRLGVQPKRLFLPERQLRRELARQRPQPDAPVIALVAKAGLASRAHALNGARGLRTALKIGAMIHILGGIVGLLSVAVLAMIGAQHLLTPINLLMFSALWMIPGLLITEWTRHS